MSVSQRLKSCIIDYERLMEDMEGLRTTEQEVKQMMSTLAQKINRKSEEIYNEMKGCFPNNAFDIGFVNRRVVLIDNKAYLLTFELSGNEPRVKEIPIERG